MTYHMEKTLHWVRSIELKSDRVEERLSLQFPWKLWQAVDSKSCLLTWNEKGTGISVNAAQFEDSVMHTHPGLVEIPTFANFRRQMREYGFDWSHCKETGDFSFSHPCFVRGRRDLTHLIVTRRKSRYVNREEANYRLSPARRSARRGRSFDCMVAARNESVLHGSGSNGSASKVVPEPPSSSQLNAISGHGCHRKGIRNIRLRHLVAESQPDSMRVEQWINLVPSPSSSSGFGLPTAPASNAPQKQLAQGWCIPVANDMDKSKEENAWWNDCFPWILQQDSDLCRQFEVDSLNAAVIEQSQKLGGIPLHFYSDDFHAVPETNNMTYPCYLDSLRTAGGIFGFGSLSGPVIEIKPISDDQEFPDI